MVLGLLWGTQDIPMVEIPDLDILHLSKRLRYQQRLREELKKTFQIGVSGPFGSKPGEGLRIAK
jgi:hypothetical protein